MSKADMPFAIFPASVGDHSGGGNWPFNPKDMEVYGTSGYVDTVVLDGLRICPPRKAEHTEPRPRSCALGQITALYGRAEVKPDGDLSWLDINVTVVRILDGERMSAKPRRTTRLSTAAK